MLDHTIALSPDSAGAAETDGCNRPVDLVHLARMTLGDRSLEREVLQVFARQATLLLARMAEADAAALAPLAHTLKGSARGVGAWRVAQAAEALEQVARDAPEARRAALSRLATAVTEADAFIRELLPA